MISKVNLTEKFKFQVKKNIDEYLSGDWLNKDIIPIQRTLELDQPKEEAKKQPELTKQDVLNKLNQQAPPEKGRSNQVTKGVNPMETDDVPPKGMMPPTPELPKKP